MKRSDREAAELTREVLAPAANRLARRAYVLGLRVGIAQPEFMAAQQSPRSFELLREDCRLAAKQLEQLAEKAEKEE